MPDSPFCGESLGTRLSAPALAKTTVSDLKNASSFKLQFLRWLSDLNDDESTSIRGGKRCAIIHLKYSHMTIMACRSHDLTITVQQDIIAIEYYLLFEVMMSYQVEKTGRCLSL